MDAIEMHTAGEFGELTEALAYNELKVRGKDRKTLATD